MINLEIDKNEVKERHAERIESVIESSKLKDLSSNWFANSSDTYKDRVYLTDLNTDIEYSVTFEDIGHGYNYIIHTRTSIPDDAYNQLIKERPELAEVNRELLAAVEQLDRGFIRKDLEYTGNFFENFLDEHDMDLDKDKIILTLCISSLNKVHNTLVQVMPYHKTCIIVPQLSFEQLETALIELSEIGSYIKGNGEKFEIARIFADGPIDILLSDIKVYLESLEYTVKRGVQNLEI